MTNGQQQLLAIILTALGVIFIPLCIALIRGIVKWTRVEDKLNELVADMKELVEAKDRTHAEMIRTMANDRAANDSRLRWLEEHYWKGRA